MLYATMLGTSNAGKTGSMHALFKDMGGIHEQKAGFSIKYNPLLPDNTDLEMRIANEGKLLTPFRVGNKTQFPPNTVGTQDWSFDFNYRATDVSVPETVAPFCWMDYKGGLLNEATSGKISDDVITIIRRLVVSQSVIIFVDSILLDQYKHRKLDISRRHTGLDQIYAILSAYDEYYGRKRKLNCMILLSKCDGVSDEYKANGTFAPLVKRGMEVCQPIINLICQTNGRWRGGVMAASSGGLQSVKTTIVSEGDLDSPPQVKAEFIDEPEPYNIKYALYYCIANVLKDVNANASRAIQKDEIEIEDAIAKDVFLHRLLARLTGKPTPREIRRQLEQDQLNHSAVIQRNEVYLRPMLDEMRKVVREF